MIRLTYQIVQFFRHLGFAGSVIFFGAVFLMPVGAAWLAFKERQPGWLALTAAWLITFGYPNKWYTNPFHNTNVWIIGTIAYLVAVVVTIGVAYLFARGLTDPESSF